MTDEKKTKAKKEAINKKQTVKSEKAKDTTAVTKSVKPSNMIEKNGFKILVGKYQPSAHFVQAMFQGDGLNHAELLVKRNEPGNPYHLEMGITPKASFDGFECRWKEIPGSHEETIVSPDIAHK